MRTMLGVIITLTLMLSGCLPKIIARDDGPFPCSQIKERIEKFSEFDAVLQKPETTMTLSEAVEKWNMGFLIEVPTIGTNKESLDPDDQRVYSARFVEGYPAAKEWYTFEMPHNLQDHSSQQANVPFAIHIGKHLIPREKFRNLRFYEAESNCTIQRIYEEPFPRFLSADARNAYWSETVKFALVALDTGEVLDVRWGKATKKEIEPLKNPWWQHPVLLLQHVLNAFTGNGPANAIPAPHIP